ncbi:MAG: hypothetical protein R2758_12545 [Bacteroidales bacterium]
MTNKLAVIALGGNALLRGDQIGTIEEQGRMPLIPSRTWFSF